jgi:hypothetical protein
MDRRWQLYRKSRQRAIDLRLVRTLMADPPIPVEVKARRLARMKGCSVEVILARFTAALDRLADQG